MYSYDKVQLFVGLQLQLKLTDLFDIGAVVKTSIFAMAQCVGMCYPLNYMF